MLSVKKYVIFLLISTLIFSVTDEYAYGTSVNVTSQSNSFENMIITLVDPVIQIQTSLVNDLNTEQNINIYNNKTKNRVTNINGNMTTTPNVQLAQSKFREIRNIPYNAHTMNCEVKSELFANYLYKNGGNNIDLVIIDHNSGNYSHEFVEWNGHYYDACNNNELSYTVSEGSYLQQLNQLGFNGLMITSPYPNGD